MWDVGRHDDGLSFFHAEGFAANGDYSKAFNNLYHGIKRCCVLTGLN